MDILRLLPEIIDFHSFSNLWFWIALAVMWSRASHFVLGVPWDMVTRARRSGDPQVIGDITALAAIHARRIGHIARTGGAALTAAVFAALSLLLVLGFGYNLHLAQALALLLIPAMLTGALSRRACLRIEEEPGPEETFRLLARHRFFVQLIGMIAIFVTSMWGMYQNLSASFLGNLPMPLLLTGGAPEGFDATRVLLEADRAKAPVLHIARDDKRAAAMIEALSVLDPARVLLHFPAWDCLPYDRISPNPELSAMRMSVLAALSHGLPVPPIVVTTLSAAMQRVPTRETVLRASFIAQVGDRVDEAALRAFLVRAGFSHSPTVTEPGDCAIRGGIVDIWPPGHDGPVRLDFFGDQLDSIRRFDAETQRSGERLTSVDLSPVSEIILDEAAIARFRQNYRVEFGTGGQDDPLYEAVSAGRKYAGMEHWMGFFHESLATLFDFMPGATVTMDDQLDAVRDARWHQISEQYDARREALSNKARLDSPYKPAPPGLLYLDEEAWLAAIADRRVVRFHGAPQPPGPGVIDAGARKGKNFAIERQTEGLNLFGALADHIRARRQHGHVVLTHHSEGSRERMAGLLADQGLTGAEAVSDLRALPEYKKGKGQLFLVIWGLEEGFEAPGLTVISEQDILGDRMIGRPRRKKKAENFLQSTTSLTPGDLVVHIEHGIGRFKGLETINALGAPHDCLALEYAGGDRLYLPVENIELLSRYGHEEGLLDKLGGGAWQARKAKLKERIREIADRLMRVAAERTLRAAPVLTPPEGLWDAFCARFPYVETDDQLASIAAVLEDLGQGSPMDRLVVGDVGFGKTEVAMRAAFVAAMSGMQVAVVAPTTLLARQHFRSFEARFKGFPLTVKPLSRFVTAKEAAKTREGLADGSVDIVVGTHAVLAQAVKFKNLGLLIIDEEQHFGVTHKERLKELRSDIHVLTLTATPIPRTLQLSLSGVRDLSVIATPPVDRLAIRTYVSEFDGVTIREALLREKYRGGQSFFVVPRISDLPDMEEFLRDQVPEVSLIVANGQLAAGELDQRMNDFYDGKADVLLATTIVESGLDIPTANTMIIHRADMFGLSQLYQIRGRVGRSKTRAYCYLTTKPRSPLTPQAERRLKLLASFDSLGAGFNLASHDLDQRGAGNLLGEEQSGHIKEVGFELYQHMLEETIAKIRSGEIEGPQSLDSDWAPQINLGVPVLIPEAYIPDLDVRLGLYRRLSGLSGKVELEGFAAELIDRFGPVPKEVNTLLLVMRIKAMCKRAGIGRLDAGPKGATVQFHGDKFPNPGGLVEYLQADPHNVKLKDNKLIIARDWPNDAEKIKGSFAIARDLAEKAKPSAGGAPKAPPKAVPPPIHKPAPPPKAPATPLRRVPVERRPLPRGKGPKRWE